MIGTEPDSVSGCHNQGCLVGLLSSYQQHLFMPSRVDVISAPSPLVASFPSIASLLSLFGPYSQALALFVCFDCGGLLVFLFLCGLIDRETSAFARCLHHRPILGRALQSRVHCRSPRPPQWGWENKLIPRGDPPPLSCLIPFHKSYASLHHTLLSQ